MPLARGMNGVVVADCSNNDNKESAACGDVLLRQTAL